MKKRALIVACTFFLALTAVNGQNSRYDEHFRSYSKKFFGVAFDWRVFKAQAMTESNLTPEARSWAGAVGIMQLLPSTFQEIASDNPELTSIDDPRWNIAAGIQYDRRLWSSWKDIPQNGERLNFVFGSYNAGRSTIVRAQEKARLDSLNHQAWSAIETVAPKVNRWRSSETLEYVKRIDHHYTKISKGRFASGRQQ
jgi:membrane-bound lytic murein transglycosylase MltF